jgi:hypothetical protein
MSRASRLLVAVAVIAVAAGGFLWWRQRPPPEAPSSPHRIAASAIRYPIELSGQQSTARLPPLDRADAFVMTALADLVGRKQAMVVLRVDGFIRRVVTAVDSLAAHHTDPERWPVGRTRGEIATDGAAGTTAIGARNAGRYAQLVGLFDGVDTQRAVGSYRRFYPLFQQAYQELGHPGGYFNDRMVEVIDDLLATPEIVEPLEVRLGTGGGGRYRFEDPTLEARSVGQKILLRIGPENAQKLKAKLVDIRRQIAAPVAPAEKYGTPSVPEQTNKKGAG